MHSRNAHGTDTNHPSPRQPKEGQCHQSTSTGGCSSGGVSSSALQLQSHKTEVERCAGPEVISTRDKNFIIYPQHPYLIPGNAQCVNLSAALFPDYNKYPHHTKHHISALITKLQRLTIRGNCRWHLTLETAFLFIIFLMRHCSFKTLEENSYFKTRCQRLTHSQKSGNVGAMRCASHYSRLSWSSLQLCSTK